MPDHEIFEKTLNSCPDSVPEQYSSLLIDDRWVFLQLRLLYVAKSAKKKQAKIYLDLPGNPLLVWNITLYLNLASSQFVFTFQSLADTA